MNTYWALVTPVPGTTIRVTVQADNPINALTLLRSLYGKTLWSTTATPV